MPHFQSPHAPRERAAQSARRLEHHRWAEPPQAAIRLRAYLWAIGLAAIIWVAVWELAR